MHEGSSHPRDEKLAFVLWRPGRVDIVIGEGGDDDRALLREYDADIVANVVQAARLIGNITGDLGRIDLLEIAWDPVAPELVPEDVDHPRAERRVAEVAPGDRREHAGHLPRGRPADAEGFQLGTSIALVRMTDRPDARGQRTSQRSHARVDPCPSDVCEDEVGRGVVALRDHQHDRRFEIDLCRRAEEKQDP